MRRLTVLVAVALAALAGCGGGAARSEKDQIRTTVRAFASASAAHDYRRLCRDVLSNALVERIQRAGVTCAEALSAGLHGVRNPRISVRSVSIDGDRAQARVRSTAAGQAPSEDTLELVREGGSWRIASLGS